MAIGFYAGSFDPFTYGHLEVVMQAAKIFDKVIIGMGVNNDKKPRFDRGKMKKAIEESMESYAIKNVEVIMYDGLTFMQNSERLNDFFLIRGLRNGTDYEYEEQLAQINKKIGYTDTLYFRACDKGMISSSAVYELWKNGVDLVGLVPIPVIELMEKER